LELLKLPLAARTIREKGPVTPGAKTRRASKLDGRDCAASSLWCQEKRLLDIVVRLWKVATGKFRPLTEEHTNRIKGADQQEIRSALPA